MYSVYGKCAYSLQRASSHNTYSRLDSSKQYARFVLSHPLCFRVRHRCSSSFFSFLSSKCVRVLFLAWTKFDRRCFADIINMKNTLNGNEKKKYEQKAPKVMAFWNPLWISIMQLLIASHTKRSANLKWISTKSYKSLRDWFSANRYSLTYFSSYSALSSFIFYMIRIPRALRTSRINKWRSKCGNMTYYWNEYFTFWVFRLRAFVVILLLILIFGFNSFY